MTGMGLLYTVVSSFCQKHILGRNATKMLRFLIDTEDKDQRPKRFGLFHIFILRGGKLQKKEWCMGTFPKAQRQKSEISPASLKFPLLPRAST